MKFGYIRREDGEVIKGYKKTDDDKLAVTYLDGSTIEFPYSIEKEKEILSVMLNQAKERDSEVALNKSISREYDSAIMHACLSVIYTALLTSLYITQIRKDEISSYFLLAFSIAAGATVIYNGKEYFAASKKQEEIDKYHLYLSIYPYIQDKPEEELTINGKSLNINSIDDISLDELIKFVKTRKIRSGK